MDSDKSMMDMLMDIDIIKKFMTTVNKISVFINDCASSLHNFYVFFKKQFDNAETISTSTNKYKEDIMTDDECWDFVFPNARDLDVDETVKLSEDLQLEQDDMIITLFDKKECSIIISDKYTKVEDFRSVVIDQNDVYDIVKTDSTIAAISKVPMFGKKYKITCNHVLKDLDMSELKLYHRLNDHLVINTKVVNPESMSWLVPNSADIKWYTKDLKTSNHLFTTTNVTYSANAYVTIKGRKCLTTLAIVVSTALNKSLLYSGTIMVARDKPYVVTYVRHNMNTLTTQIIALAAMPHNYTIKVKSKNE